MIEKKDWELVLKSNEENRDKLIQQNEQAENVALPQFEAIILLAKHKLAEFPDDPIPKEVSEVIQEVKK